MTDPKPVGAETKPPSIAASDHAALLTTPPVRQDTSSSSGSGPYSPLPDGRWTVPFHGNCPRCHHHHKAVQVKVNVGPDSSQVSYIRCEQCREKWAAFGGRSTTQISLLSDTTTEPDPLEKELRYSLMEVVRAATNVASLGGIAELPTHGISRHPSNQFGGGTRSNTADQPQGPSTSTDLEEFTHLRHDQQYQLPHVSTYPTIEMSVHAKNRSRPHQLASKLKRSVSARLSESQREALKRLLPASRQSKMSARQLEKSPVRTPPTEAPSDAPDPRSHAADHVVDDLAARSSVTNSALLGPSEPHAEVSAYIESLDKTGLAAMSEQERASWMREKYTAFKVRHKSNNASLGFSTIVETSIRTELPCFSHRPSNRQSFDLMNAGTHIEGLERLLNEVASRRSTMTISDANSEAQSTSDENTVAVQSRYSRQLQRVRRGLGPQRPRSMPNVVPRSPPISYHQTRNSIDMLRHSEAGSTSSIQGQTSQASSRLSQDSTLHGTVMSDHASVSRSSHRQP